MHQVNYNGGTSCEQFFFDCRIRPEVLLVYYDAERELLAIAKFLVSYSTCVRHPR